MTINRGATGRHPRRAAQRNVRSTAALPHPRARAPARPIDQALAQARARGVDRLPGLADRSRSGAHPGRGAARRPGGGAVRAPAGAPRQLERHGRRPPACGQPRARRHRSRSGDRSRRRRVAGGAGRSNGCPARGCVSEGARPARALRGRGRPATSSSDGSPDALATQLSCFDLYSPSSLPSVSFTAAYQPMPMSVLGTTSVPPFAVDLRERGIDVSTRGSCGRRQAPTGTQSRRRGRLGRPCRGSSG